MRWIYAILAYVLLILSCALTLYFLELESVQTELAEATHRALSHQLGQSPGFQPGKPLEVIFSARKGQVIGVAATATGAQIGREAVERLAVEGLPDDAQTKYDFAELSHDWKRLPEFQLFGQAEEMALRADLAPSTLAKLKEAVRKATGAEPGPPIDPEGNQPEPPAVGQDDVEVPDWEETFGDAVEYILQHDRLRQPELWLAKDQTLRVIGFIDTKQSADKLQQRLREGFPSLADHIDNRVEIQREPVAFDLKVEGDKITLEGAVPSTDIQIELIDYIKAQLPPGQVLAPAIQVIPGAEPPVWLESKPSFFKRVFAEIESIRMIISHDEVMLGGDAPSKTIADELANLVQSQLSSHTFHNRLSYPHEAATP